jgi:hypothetical protein
MSLGSLLSFGRPDRVRPATDNNPIKHKEYLLHVACGGYSTMEVFGEGL